MADKVANDTGKVSKSHETFARRAKLRQAQQQNARQRSPLSCRSGRCGRIVAVRQGGVPEASGAEPAGLEGTGMSIIEGERERLEGQSPADDWEARATQRVLDELFLI